jgi:hypothetical protein
MPLPSPIVGVHLDLKYLMPSQQSLLAWVDDLADSGVNTLLLEYEDAFPYKTYPFLKRAEGFTPENLTAFLSAARTRNITIIPLVQTLSHLEFALAHQELAHLREAPHIHTQIDTSSPQAAAFVKTLIDDVLEFHGPDQIICLGADEAWHMGNNPRTKAALDQLGTVRYWAKHVSQFVDHARSKGKRAMVWDDAFWKDPSSITDSGLDKSVILASWDYASSDTQPDIDKLVDRVSHYTAAGHDVVGAPCFNWGVLAPRHDHCLNNTRAWALASKQSGILGVINTAWASFHVLPQIQVHMTSAFAGMMNRPDASWTDQDLARQCTAFFGADCSDVPQALRGLDGFWELTVPGRARPITPIIYGYMDLILWYKDIHQRAAQGVYPPDLLSVPYLEIFRQKLAIMQDQNTSGPNPGAVTAKLQSLLPGFQFAQTTFSSLAIRATAHQPHVHYFAWAAKLKLTHARLLIAHLAQSADSAAIADWALLGQSLPRTLSPFATPRTIQILNAVWWLPTAQHLALTPSPSGGGLG